MTRSDQWPKLLASFIEARRGRPFAWGENDCCLFAADWIREATGRDIACDYRGKYHSALSAARILQNEGGVLGVFRKAAERERMIVVTPSHAQRGDIVARDSEDGPLLGVCIGALGAFVTERGLRFVQVQGERDIVCWRF